MEMLTYNLQIHGASFQHNLRVGQSEYTEANKGHIDNVQTKHHRS